MVGGKELRGVGLAIFVTPLVFIVACLYFARPSPRSKPPPANEVRNLSRVRDPRRK
jgi:hypothetical protein